MLIIIKRFWFIFFVVPIFAEEDVPAFKTIKELLKDNVSLKEFKSLPSVKKEIEKIKKG